MTDLQSGIRYLHPGMSYWPLYTIHSREMDTDEKPKTEVENILNGIGEEMKPINELLSSMVKRHKAIPFIKEIDGQYVIGLAIDESTITAGSQY